MPEPNRVYNVRLKANAEVFTNVYIEASSTDEAEKLALKKVKDAGSDYPWQFDSWESIAENPELVRFD